MAPNYVSWHMEHHMMPAVPGFRLPAFHAFCKERGLFSGDEDTRRSYLAVIEHLVSRDRPVA